jgi:hypothetical protein
VAIWVSRLPMKCLLLADGETAIVPEVGHPAGTRNRMRGNVSKAKVFSRAQRQAKALGPGR